MEALHDTNPDIPVIILTASAMKPEREKISLLSEGYMDKPISKSNLVLALMKFLPYTRKEKELEALHRIAEKKNRKYNGSNSSKPRGSYKK